MLIPVSNGELGEGAAAACEYSSGFCAKFNFGAAIDPASGKIYVGANVENVSYPAHACAEDAVQRAMIALGETYVVESGISQN